MLRHSTGKPLRIVAIVLALACTGAGATAATRHAFDISQGTGSGGARDFLQGTASGGALQGEVASSPDTGISLPFGLFGVYDPPGSTFGVGVLGVSTTGYAIAGESLSATQPTMLAYAGGGGIGLEATSSSSSSAEAIYAEARGSGNGIIAQADGAANGVRGNSDSAYNGVYGNNTGSGAGVLGFSQSGQGVYAYSAGGVGAFVVNGNDSMDTMTIDQGQYPSTGDALYVENQLGGLLAVESNGNLLIRGSLTSGDMSTQRTHNPNSDVMSYSAQTSQPVIEDFGTAQLVDGSATVALASDFRQTIDGTTRYLVS